MPFCGQEWLRFLRFGALCGYTPLSLPRLQVQTGSEHQRSCSLLADGAGDYKFRI